MFSTYYCLCRTRESANPRAIASALVALGQALSGRPLPLRVALGIGGRLKTGTIRLVHTAKLKHADCLNLDQKLGPRQRRDRQIIHRGSTPTRRGGACRSDRY